MYIYYVPCMINSQEELITRGDVMRTEHGVQVTKHDRRGVQTYHNAYRTTKGYNRAYARFIQIVGMYPSNDVTLWFRSPYTGVEMVFYKGK